RAGDQSDALDATVRHPTEFTASIEKAPGQAFAVGYREPVVIVILRVDDDAQRDAPERPTTCAFPEQESITGGRRRQRTIGADGEDAAATSRQGPLPLTGREVPPPQGSTLVEHHPIVASGQAAGGGSQ